MIDTAIEQLSPLVGVKAACDAVGRPRASHYRAHPVAPASSVATATERPPRAPQPRAPQPRALSTSERDAVLDVLHSERFVDMAPAEVYATLLDEGVYLCSESTMYRLLREHGETGDRRRHATHPARVKPELMADAPNRVWSWDIERHEAP